jgi:hypothetical protein
MSVAIIIAISKDVVIRPVHQYVLMAVSLAHPETASCEKADFFENFRPSF